MVTSPAWFVCRGRGGRPSWYAGSTAGSRGFGGWCVEQWNSITATLLVYDAHMLTPARGGRQGGGPDLAGPAEPALGSRPMSDAERGTFKNVVHERDAAPPRPVDEYLAELDRLIAAHDYFKQDKVIPAIGRGAASREVVQHLALEFYYLGKWMTPEFALLVANAA